MINWNILKLECKQQEDDLTDVVVTAHWQCLGTQDEYIAQVYGIASFTIEQGTGFTPYAELTQDQVLDWCYTNGVDKDDTETSVNAQLAAKINPPLVTLPLPWEQTVEPTEGQ